MTTIAYVYKWTHIPTLKWYVGRRTKQGCHPGDGYICSSKVIKPWIQSNPEQWQRTIIATGSTQAMIDLEADILETFDASSDPRSFNMTNGDGKFNHSLYPGPMTGKKHSEETRAKIGVWGKGRIQSEEEKLKKSLAHKGKKKTPEHIEKIAVKNRGKKASDETRAKMSEKRKGHNNNTAESIAKCLATKLERGSHKHSEETKAKIKAAHLARVAAKNNQGNL